MDLLALLFPREKKFYKMVEEQVTLVGEAVADFYSLILKFNKLSSSKQVALISSISKKEKQDDILYTQMVRALKSTFITPMDREDIHQLVVTFDTIINTLELMTQKFTVFGIRNTDKQLIAQTEILYKAYLLIEKTIFAIRDESQVEKYCLQMRKLEQKADEVFIKALKNLFSDSITPVDIIKYQDLYTSMEKMIDQLNEASLIIENLAVKYS